MCNICTYAPTINISKYTLGEVRGETIPLEKKRVKKEKRKEEKKKRKAREEKISSDIHDHGGRTALFVRSRARLV